MNTCKTTQWSQSDRGRHVGSSDARFEVASTLSMRTTIKIIATALLSGGLLTVLIVWLYDQNVLLTWLACSTAIGAIFFLMELNNARARVRIGRWGAIRRRIEELAESYSAYEAWPDEPEICFLGIKKMSDAGPVYMFAASRPYRLNDSAQRNENDDLMFRDPNDGLLFAEFPGFPALPRGTFAYRSSRLRWVPAEIATDTVQLFNSALAAPFTKGKVEAALDLLDAAPWEMHTKRNPPNLFSTPDPYSRRKDPFA